MLEGTIDAAPCIALPSWMFPTREQPAWNNGILLLCSTDSGKKSSWTCYPWSLAVEGVENVLKTFRRLLLNANRDASIGVKVQTLVDVHMWGGCYIDWLSSRWFDACIFIYILCNRLPSPPIYATIHSMHEYIHKYIQPYRHTYNHIYNHTYNHTYIQTNSVHDSLFPNKDISVFR